MLPLLSELAWSLPLPKTSLFLLGLHRGKSQMDTTLCSHSIQHPKSPLYQGASSPSPVTHIAKIRAQPGVWGSQDPKSLQQTQPLLPSPQYLPRPDPSPFWGKFLFFFSFSFLFNSFSRDFVVAQANRPQLGKHSGPLFSNYQALMARCYYIKSTK